MRDIKQMVLVGISVFLFTSTIAIAQSQDEWGKYRPRTLREIIDQHSQTASDEKAKINLLFTADVFPSRVTVIYTGESRKVSSTRKAFITEWGKTRKLSPELVALFEDELLFKEGEVEYWLPVQKQIIPYFKAELKSGERVELYLIWIGARNEGDVTDWVFLVNEFERITLTSPPAKRLQLTRCHDVSYVR